MRKSSTYWCVFDLPQKEQELLNLQKQTESDEFWQQPDQAQEVMRKISALREDVLPWTELKQKIIDAMELAKLEDESLREELENELAQVLLRK